MTAEEASPSPVVVPPPVDQEAHVDQLAAEEASPSPVVVVPPPVDQEVHVDQLAAVTAEIGTHPELRALARLEIAAEIAAEGRPLNVLRRALTDLARDARTAAAVGERWTPAILARKARVYVRLAWAIPGTPEHARRSASTSTSSTPRRPLPPSPPPRLADTATHLRALTAALVHPLGEIPAGRRSASTSTSSTRNEA